MLKIILICFSIGLIFQTTFGQHCIPTAIVFSTQTQVDNFATDYPGCTVIDGNVGITGDDISNLDGLTQITQILGSVQIIHSNSLTNIVGLNNVSQIGGFLKIENNYILNNINGFLGLLTLGGDLSIKDDGLTTISGFSNLSTIGGNVLIADEGLSNLTGFSNLTTIDGNMNINENNLSDVSGFLNLNSIGGTLHISGSEYYHNLSGLTNLTTIGGSLEIQVPGYFNITGLTNLIRIGNTFQLFCQAIINISGLNNLKKIGANLILGYGFVNSNSLFGFNHLDSIYGNFTINQNGPIGIDVSHFNNIKYIGNSINFQGALTNLGQFVNIDTIYGSLTIFANPVISDLTNFEFIKKINEGLSINNNNVLTSITGFQNLESVNDFGIGNQNFLSDISGFDHPMNITHSLSISGNPFLSNCSVEGICDNVWKTNVFSIFDNNNTGCASKSQVQQSCPPLPDADGDGIPDITDNCPNVSNPTQSDTNNNGIGDACDTTDTDSDGIIDLLDNCKYIPNPDQADDNNNGIGNVCEDGDSDEIPDVVDNCPTVNNPHQTDLNNNGIGDACEVFPKTGINTSTPKSELHLSNGSLFIDNPEKGIIFKAYNGNCYVLRATGNSNPQFILVPCPQ